MLSKWKVRETDVAGATFFEVYRYTDAAREKDRTETFGGIWSDEDEAQRLAMMLNKEEERK